MKKTIVFLAMALMVVGVMAMAKNEKVLQKTIMQDTGVEVTTWKAESIRIDLRSGKAMVILLGYASEEAYTSGKEAMVNRNVYVDDVTKLEAFDAAYQAILAEVLKRADFAGATSKTVEKEDK